VPFAAKRKVFRGLQLVNSDFPMDTRRLLTVLFTPVLPLLAVNEFLRVTKDFRMVIFYNKKLKNLCYLLGNRAEPLKYAAQSSAFYCTMCEGAFLETRKSIFS